MYLFVKNVLVQHVMVVRWLLNKKPPRIPPFWGKVPFYHIPSRGLPRRGAEGPPAVFRAAGTGPGRRGARAQLEPGLISCCLLRCLLCLYYLKTCSCLPGLITCMFRWRTMQVTGFSHAKTASVIARGVSRETSSRCSPLPSHDISRTPYHARWRVAGLRGQKQVLRLM